MLLHEIQLSRITGDVNMLVYTCYCRLEISYLLTEPPVFFYLLHTFIPSKHDINKLT